MSSAGGAGPLLAIDAGSPRVSVAIGDHDGILAEASGERQRSSTTLLALIDAALDEAGLRAADLAGMVALRGPGSFTGLRVGLATALGLHQALGLPATGVATLEVLASLGDGDGSTVVAVVDALRDQWFAQPFRSAEPPRPLGEPRLIGAAEIGGLGPALVAGFDAARLIGGGTPGLRALEPPPLAGAAVRLYGRFPPPWNPASLVEPLYLRPPSAKPPADLSGRRAPWSRRRP